MSEDVWLKTPYGKVRDYLFDQLVLLSHYSFYIERIGTFPWLALGIRRDHFWEDLPRAYIDSFYTIAFRAFVDDKPKRASVSKLLELAISLGKTQEEQEAIELSIDKAHFTQVKSTLKERVVQLRHNLVAHQNLEMILDHGQQIIRVSRKLLDGIFEPARNMFEAVVKSVEGEKGFSYWHHEYSNENRANYNTPFDKLLLGVAEKSSVLRLPENFPQEWDQYRARMTMKEIGEFNDIRLRVGLNPVE